VVKKLKKAGPVIKCQTSPEPSEVRREKDETKNQPVLKKTDLWERCKGAAFGDPQSDGEKTEENSGGEKEMVKTKLRLVRKIFHFPPYKPQVGGLGYLLTHHLGRKACIVVLLYRRRLSSLSTRGKDQTIRGNKEKDESQQGRMWGGHRVVVLPQRCKSEGGVDGTPKVVKTQSGKN